MNLRYRVACSTDRVVLCSTLLDSRQQVEVGDSPQARGSIPSLLRTSESPDSMAPRTAQTLLPHIVQQLIWFTAKRDRSGERLGSDFLKTVYIHNTVVDIYTVKCLSIYQKVHLIDKLVNHLKQIYVYYGFCACTFRHYMGRGLRPISNI